MGVSYGSGSDRPDLRGIHVRRRFGARRGGALARPQRPGRGRTDGYRLEFRREHLRIQQRSHYVITEGGDQPNVVPPRASVWYYFREIDYPHIKEMFETGNTIARAAAMMTGTKVSWRILGSAWPTYFNQPVAEAVQQNIAKVGLPQWTEDDQALAKAVQRQAGANEKGLSTEADPIGLPVKDEDKKGGGSDDIGDVSWNVPTITLRYPSNMPGLPGHSWLDSIAMATPIAHKGATAGAKVMAMTVVDLLMRPELIEKAAAYFREVQTREVKYTPLIGPEDKPAIHLNRKTMEQFRPEMRKLYFDRSRYRTYLEQLGVRYPTLAKPGAGGSGAGEKQ